MKNLILSALFLCLVQLAVAQTRVTDLSQQPYKGPVKKVTTYIIRTQNHETPDSTAKAEKTVETFDRKGWPQEERSYDKNGQLRDRMSFKCIGDSIVERDQAGEGGMPPIKYLYKYDNKGRETEFDMTMAASAMMAKTDYRSYYSYDDFGNMIVWAQYIDGNRLTSKTISTYNNKHQEIQSVAESFFNNNEKKTKIVYTYDENGNLVKSENYDANGNAIGGNAFSYSNLDKYGNWLKGTSSMNGQSSNQGNYTFTTLIKRVIEYY